jgi:hypothetical protein
MTHARGAVSHTIKLPRGQRAEGHDCLELKGREKRRQYVGAAVHLFACWSAIAEKPLSFVKRMPRKCVPQHKLTRTDSSESSVPQIIVAVGSENPYSIRSGLLVRRV